MSRMTRRILFWSPRLLAIAFCLFISMFALDVFNERHGVWQVILAFLIHLIPTALVGILLVVAWRWEWVGTAAYTALAVLYAFMVLPGHPDWFVVVGLPLLIIAGLFLAGWIKRAELHPAH